METVELYRLGEWVDQKIVVENEIIDKYNNLIALLNKNLRRQANQPAESFDEQKNELYESLNNISFIGLTLAQIHSLKTLGIYENIGRHAVEALEDLFLNTLDLAHVHASLTQYKDQLTEGVQITHQINTSIEPLIDEDDLHLPPEKILTRVIFDHDAAITDINELKEWSESWFEIGRGFAMATGGSPEDVEVIGGSRGSFILELALYATIAIPVLKAINLTLEGMVKYQTFRKKGLEIRQMMGEFPEIAGDLENDAKKWDERAEQSKQQISEEVSEKLQKEIKEFKKDARNEFNRGIKRLVDFMSKGGDIDCVISDDEDESEKSKDDNNAIRQDFARLRDLQNQLKLEFNSEEEDEETEDDEQDPPQAEE